ncbi:short-chain dehydrogenase [Paractinoplanes deccanensis]|uniref:Short-chain dehydrogenase n=2 Tax=Paractinoplanes deccanensis TaxID=113561 RepID=A0ABQ3YJY9_9ACTN|nr:short-chain dehydrogenase [Actinoplanes deccanensis]
MLTGATSGLGEIAALDLAARGHDLILVARDPGRASRIAPATQVDVVIADLADLSQVRRAAAEIRARHPKIDVLINNAGLHAFTARTTAAGLPEMVTVNYLAPWLLTRELLETSPERIVTVASEASRRHGTFSLPSALTDTSPFTRRGSSAVYGRTKLLDIMFNNELARRTSAVCLALDPGFNTTGLGRELPGAAVLEKVLKALHVGDPRRGAGGIVRLATDPVLTGGYFSARTGRPITPVAPAGDAALERRLWEMTEEIVDSVRA